MRIISLLTASALFVTLSFGGEFTLHSNDLAGRLTMKQVFSGFGCSGENISPAQS